MRLMHESSYHNQSMFLTLTYDDDHLPANKSLRKSDLQKFLKRLRKNLHTKIKYYACGEYGEPSRLLPNGRRTDGDRPHYHMILFGLGLNDYDKSLVINNWPACTWDKRLVQKSFGHVEPDSIQYVCAYINKKLSGDMADAAYTDTGREPVFRLLSNGLGKQYAIDHADQIKEHGINLRGLPMTIPRYYINLLGIDVDDLKERALDRERDKLQEYNNLSLTRDEMYMQASVGEILAVEKTIQIRNKQKEISLTAKQKLFNTRDLN